MTDPIEDPLENYLPEQDNPNPAPIPCSHRFGIWGQSGYGTNESDTYLLECFDCKYLCRVLQSDISNFKLHGHLTLNRR